MQVNRLNAAVKLALVAAGLASALPAGAAADVSGGVLTVAVSSGSRDLTSDEVAAISSTEDPLTEVRKTGAGKLTVSSELSAFKGNIRISEGSLSVSGENPALGPYDENSPGKIIIESSSASKAKLMATGCTFDKPIEVTPNNYQFPIACSGPCVFNGQIKLTSIGIAYFQFNGSGTSEETVLNGRLVPYYDTQTFNFSGSQTVRVKGGISKGIFEFGGGDGYVRMDKESMPLSKLRVCSSGRVYFDRDYCLSSSNTALEVVAQWGYTYLNGTTQAFGNLGPFTLNNVNVYALNNGITKPATVEFRQTTSMTNVLGKFTGNLDFRKSGAATFGLNYNGSISCKSRVEVSDGLFDMGPDCQWSGCSNILVRGTGAFAFGRSSAFPSSLVVGVEDSGMLAVRGGVVQTCSEFWVDGVKMPAGTYGGEASAAENKLSCFTDDDAGILDVQAKTYSWNGGSGDWNDAASWTSSDGSGVPGAGDSVVIASGSAALPGSTPRFYSVNVDGGELVFTNWTTRLEAQTVHVAAGGVITCAGAFTNEAAKCRVWIDCGDLVVDAGGRIDVDAKGWSGGLTTVHTTVGSWEGCTGWGPGGGRMYAGASHGGRGAVNYYNFPNVPTYGDSADPAEPGSGGYMKSGWLGGDYTDADASHGGGAVKITATGSVTVNGSVTACGRGTRVSRGLSANYGMQTAGSGGSISVTCSTLAGAGIIVADGGKGDKAIHPRALYQSCTYWNGMAGGGGRIAVRYDSSKQTAESVAGLRISAKYGMYSSSELPLTTATIDRTRISADLGTLSFTDDKLVEALYGKGLCGRVVGFGKSLLEFDGDLDYTWGDCRIERDGLQVRVNGDLTVTGQDSRMEIGALETVVCSVTPTVSAGTSPARLTVVGDFVVSNAAVDVRAATVSAQGGWGAFVDVHGSMSVLAKGYVYAWSDPMSLCAPKFDVGGDFAVASNGCVSASWRGGSGSSDSIPGITSAAVNWRKGVGPGRGSQAGAGSHGGLGGRSAGSSPSAYAAAYAVGPVYDDPYVPSQPGSGGGQSGFGVSGCGGGVVHLMAAGAILVDGTVEADGGIPAYSASDFTYIDCACAGSGGTVFLSGLTFGGSGTLSARGGNAYYDTGAPRYPGAGGGGRIAVWSGGAVWDDSMRTSRIISSAAPDLEGMSWSGVATASGGTVLPQAGTSAATGLDAAASGGDGTVWYCRLRPKGGILLIAR